MPIITNQGNNTLEKALIKALPEAESVDILTAYFYFSGFRKLAKHLKDKKIRILVGSTIDPATIDSLMTQLKVNPNIELDPYQSRTHATDSRSSRKKYFIESFIGLFNRSALSEDFDDTEGQECFEIFTQKLTDGSMEIKMTRDRNHAKMYALRGKSSNKVFSGSSNFTFAGLMGQGELDDSYDGNKALDYIAHFDELWNDADCVNICCKDNNQEFLGQIKDRLWINAKPDPYKIYLRILHELYANQTEETVKYPHEISRGRFSNLKYQLDAVKQGLDCLEKYNGVIIADVVGLGKSIIAASIAYNLDIPKTVIIAPPHLKQQWEDYAVNFGLRGVYVESGGKLELVHRRFANDQDPILYIIDEAHRYRNELTDNYQYLHQLTRSNPNNKVILLTATPYNNKPEDLFALIKLFQTPSRSTINSVDNLGLRFHNLIAEYRKLEKQSKKDNRTQEVTRQLESLAQSLRILIDPVVIRRSRLDLQKINEYAEDLKRQKITFPEVVGPELVEYELGELSPLYEKTLTALTDDEIGFSGARYQSTSYIHDLAAFIDQYGQFFDESDLQTAQSNLAKFMRRLLVARFESSKYAFKKTLENIIRSHETILEWWNDKGLVPIQKHGEILSPEELPSLDDDIEDFLKDLETNQNSSPKKGRQPILVPKEFFDSQFATDVERDLQLLQKLRDRWFAQGHTGYDPKLQEVTKKIKELLQENPDRKIVIFSSYADTANWVAKSLKKNFSERVLLYTGQMSENDKEVVSKNFDASYPEQSNDYDVLVATDALSEGFNLHRAGVIINYDIPYNPTRVVQRIGRINRINKKMFDKIFIYNFFPTSIGEDITNIKGISTLKMLLINNIVGSDTKTLTPDETLQSYFKRQYQDADQESQEISWDVDYINDYNSIKHDSSLIKELEALPERSRIVRTNNQNDMAIAFAKRGNNAIFATCKDGNEAKLLSPELVLGYFKATSSEKAKRGDEKLDHKFKVVYDAITAKYPVPKVEGRRKDALSKIEFLIERCPQDKDYLNDVRDVIYEFDDFSEGELKFIAQLPINDDSHISESVNNLKQRISDNYLQSIIDKAAQVSSAPEIMMFLEDLRTGN